LEEEDDDEEEEEEEEEEDECAIIKSFMMAAEVGASQDAVSASRSCCTPRASRSKVGQRWDVDKARDMATAQTSNLGLLTLTPRLLVPTLLVEVVEEVEREGSSGRGRGRGAHRSKLRTSPCRQAAVKRP
jgi:hypothetical protein